MADDTDNDDNDVSSTDNTASSTTLILPEKNASPELQVIGKNDEHTQSMVTDKEFYKDMQQKNEQANQLMNLNNAALTQAGSNAAQGADVLVANTNEDFINKKWRPMMGWMYMAVCVCDFIIFPVAWSVLQAMSKGSVTTPWQPLSLQGAGLFHIAMGAVLGIAAYGRTQEKIQGASTVSTAVGAAVPGK
jgi:hypothetical protein